MIQKKIDPGIARQVFAIMDDIRRQMLFRKQFGITKQLSRLELNLANQKLLFTDIGNLSAGLDARELTIYWYFLRHPEGVGYAFVADHIEEIKYLYRHFSSDANLPDSTTLLITSSMMINVLSALLVRLSVRSKARLLKQSDPKLPGVTQLILLESIMLFPLNVTL